MWPTAPHIRVLDKYLMPEFSVIILCQGVNKLKIMLCAVILRVYVESVR